MKREIANYLCVFHVSDFVKENRKILSFFYVVKCCVVILQLLIMTLVVIHLKLKTEQKVFFFISVLKCAAASEEQTLCVAQRFSITVAFFSLLLFFCFSVNKISLALINNLVCGYEGRGFGKNKN